MQTIYNSKTILFYLVLLTTFSSLFSLSTHSTNAMQTAAKENKYLYLFFYKEKDEKTKNLEKILDEVAQKHLPEVSTLKILVSDDQEKPLIEKFKLKNSPMPTLLVLAPNEAITGGFLTFTENDLTEALVSKGAALCLKALQDKKLVVLCLQNSDTNDNEKVLKAVKDFTNDPRFATACEMVMIDPLDLKEKKFLHQLSCDIPLKNATTILLSPPGDILQKYVGPITKEQIVSDITKSTKKCCLGGCCPNGKCGN